MFFKNVRAYRFKTAANYNADDFNQALAQDSARPCGEQEQITAGWTRPYPQQDDRMAIFYERRILLCMQTTERLLPAKVVNEEVAARINEVEQREQRPVMRNEKEDIKDGVITHMLPRAFTHSTNMHAMIDMDNGLIVINTANAGKAENLLAMLRRSLGTLPVVPALVKQDLVHRMSECLCTGTSPEGFQLGNKAELTDSDKGKIKLTDKTLTTSELQEIMLGEQATALQLVHKSGLAATVHESGALKQLDWDQKLLEANADMPKEDALLIAKANLLLATQAISEFVTDLHNASTGAFKEAS